MKKTALLWLLCAGLGLTGCSALPVSLSGSKTARTAAKETAKETDGETAKETKEEQPEETARETQACGEGTEETSLDDDPELKLALYRSTAETVQMEITTGLTTEYLSPLINYPALVRKDGNEQILEDENDLEELGLRELYTDELLAAVGDFDVEQLEIREDGTAIVGDPKLAYVVLGRDEYDYIGIEEFYCGG